MQKILTPWGMLHALEKEFYFFPKFPVSMPPYDSEGHFISDTIKVMMKYTENNGWVFRKVFNVDQNLEDVYLEKETLEQVRLQGKFRLNCALKFYKEHLEKEKILDA